MIGDCGSKGFPNGTSRLDTDRAGSRGGFPAETSHMEARVVFTRPMRPWMCWTQAPGGVGTPWGGTHQNWWIPIPVVPGILIGIYDDLLAYMYLYIHL